MKLLYLVSQINNVGGLARIVIDKINWLVDHGYDVTICNIETVDIHPAYSLDPKVKLIKGGIATTPGGFCVRVGGIVKSVKKIYNIVGKESPDIIVNVHCPLISWFLPLIYKRIPKIIEIHQSKQGLEVFNRTYFHPIVASISNTAIRWCYNMYDRFVVLTTDDRKDWNLNNCVTIHNFVDFPNHGTCKYEKKKQILMLTRLVPQKRIDLMIEIWNLVSHKFPDWKVVVMGEGQERQRLEEMIRKYNMENSFLLLGETYDRKIVEKALEDSSILCLTSEYEGSALSLLEAMHKQTAVISYDISGVSDTIEDGVNGFVVSPFGDKEQYAKKLVQLMSSEPLRKKMTEKMPSVMKKFDKEIIMKEWETLFAKLVPSRLN